MVFFLIMLFGIAGNSYADGTLVLEISGLKAKGKLKKVKAEVYRVDGPELNTVYEGDAFDLNKNGVQLPSGKYKVYIEDQKTGLIMLLDNAGKGYELADGGTIEVSGPDFVAKVDETKEKANAERKALKEMSKGKKKAIFAEGDEDPGGEEGPDYAPGDLLLKYATDTNLAERYQFLLDLEAESRNKISAIDIYRVRVDEGSDPELMIQTHSNDHRLSCMEMNKMVSVPDPVDDGDTRRE